LALVNIETHIKVCLIKSVARLKTESLGKLLIGIYGISLPVNVADFILRPFMHRYMGFQALRRRFKHIESALGIGECVDAVACYPEIEESVIDRKSTRLNSSHVSISYAVFCLKQKSNRSQP